MLERHTFENYGLSFTVPRLGVTLAGMTILKKEHCTSSARTILKTFGSDLFKSRFEITEHRINIRSMYKARVLRLHDAHRNCLALRQTKIMQHGALT